MATTEDLVIWIDDLNGHIFNISGGDREGNEGIRLAFETSGTMFEDIYESPVTAIYNSTAFEIGGRYGGMREDMFEFALAFNIKPTDNLPWRVAESRFRKALSFIKDARIYVQVVGQSTRYLSVRLMETPKLKVVADPNKMKYGLLLVKFVGAFPRWCEDDSTSTWVCATDTSANLAVPNISSHPTSTTGGTLGAATYWYKVTAIGNLSGETTGSTEISQATTGSTSSVTLNWGAVSNAAGYKIYRSTTSGSETLLATVGTVTTYTDTGSSTNSTSVPNSNTAFGKEVGSITISNPTNCEQRVKYMAQAGNNSIVWTLPDYSWGDNRFQRASVDASRMIIMPALTNGENIIVDTDEMTMAGQVISSLDTAVYLRMSGVEFLYPVPAYTPPTTMPVAVTGARVGNGIQVRNPLSWSRPWGLEG